MRLRYGIAAVVFALTASAPASAQFIVGGGFGVRQGVGFTYHTRRVAVSGFVTSSRFAYAGPLVRAPFGTGSVFAPLPYWAPRFGFGAYYLPTPVVAVAVPIPVPVAIGIRPAAFEPDPDDDNLLRVRPRRPAERVPVPAPPPPAPAPPPMPKRAPFDPWRPIPKPADPKTEATDQRREGQRAFAAGEYGRAAERFAHAVALDPTDPMGHFLLAQAQFARGKYHEASAAIHAGARRRPTWPADAVRPRNLYSDRDADFDQHLQRLRATLARYPDDPVLLFLLGHQLWFDGRRDEAIPLLKRALPLVTDPTVIERLLAAGGGMKP